MPYYWKKNKWKKKRIRERQIKKNGGDCTELDRDKYRFYLYPRGDVDFTIYSHPECPYSVAALEALNRSRMKNGEFIKYRNFDYVVSFVDPKFSVDISGLSRGWKTVPLVFRGKEFIGGFQELMTVLKNDFKIDKKILKKDKKLGSGQLYGSLLGDAWRELRNRCKKRKRH